MESRVSLIMVISLVCVSLFITFWFSTRFLGEEYLSINPLPSLPLIPKESVETAFLYPPEVFRDPFKGPIISRPKIETTPVVETREILPPPKVTTPIEHVPSKVTQEKPKSQVVQPPPLPRFKVTGIIYDENPIAIVEFNGQSSILGEESEITKDLKVRKIYIDSIDVLWKGKNYNVKLGGN
ncbi:MAG: hypothetical protein ACP5RW_03485 [bacterium]